MQEATSNVVINQNKKSDISCIPGLFSDNTTPDIDFTDKTAQPTFTCSKLTIETLESRVKYAQS